MKHSHLQQIVNTMQSFTQITKIFRTNSTQICIEFDRDTLWTFDMRRDNAMIFIAPKNDRTKIYQAPFDVLLAKKFNRSTIQAITMHNSDKIIRIEATQSSSYKSETTLFQLEFTGKYTNAILLDKQEIVLEALRHIDEEKSTRNVHVGQRLLNPPKPDFTPIFYPIDSVISFLHSTYDTYAASSLEKLKKEKQALISKRLHQYQSHLDALKPEENILQESITLQHFGQVILGNLSAINGYETQLKLNDFDGTPLIITPPKECATGTKMAELLFKQAKKGKQKAAGQFRERQNLIEKIRHLELFKHTITTARSPEQISLLFPKKATRSKIKIKTPEGIEEFWIDGIKISLGKSEQGNIELLRNSRARDIWLHLKDRPSTHVIISTDKQELPTHILQSAAKLCVDFSVFEKGTYLVDYTPRREVRIQEGANVLYTKYNTLPIVKQ